MQWILLLVIVAALLYLSRYFPKIAFSLLGALVIAAAAFIFSTSKETGFSRSRLLAENIVIENPVIVSAYGGSYRLSARLVNTHDKYEVKDAMLSITMLDCKNDDENDCQVIGQESERIIVRIPPGQSRDVSQTYTFGPVNPESTLQWQFAITETRS